MALEASQALLVAVGRARRQTHALADDIAAGVTSRGVIAFAAAAGTLWMAVVATVLKRAKDRRGHGWTSWVADAIVAKVATHQTIGSRGTVAAEALGMAFDTFLR